MQSALLFRGIAFHGNFCTRIRQHQQLAITSATDDGALIHLVCFIARFVISVWMLRMQRLPESPTQRSSTWSIALVIHDFSVRNRQPGRGRGGTTADSVKRTSIYWSKTRRLATCRNKHSCTTKWISDPKQKAHFSWVIYVCSGSASQFFILSSAFFVFHLPLPHTTNFVRAVVSAYFHHWPSVHLQSLFWCQRGTYPLLLSSHRD